MTRLALPRIEHRARVRTTLALLKGCSDIPRFRRVLTRIEKDRKRQMKGFRK